VGQLELGLFLGEGGGQVVVLVGLAGDLGVELVKGEQVVV